MVRKVKNFALVLVLIVAMCNTAQAQTIEPYDGNMSSTVVSYFRDIVSNMPLGSHYIALRYSDTEYHLYIGSITEESGTYTIETGAKRYTITSSNYGAYDYVVTDTAEEIIIHQGVRLLYSDLGNNPQLLGIGEKYEILQTITLCAIVLFALFARVFGRR